MKKQKNKKNKNEQNLVEWVNFKPDRYNIVNVIKRFPFGFGKEIIYHIFDRQTGEIQEYKFLI